LARNPGVCALEGALDSQRADRKIIREMARKLTLLDKLMRVPAVKESARFLATSLTSVENIRRGLRYGTGKGYIERRIWQFLPVDVEFEIFLPDGESLKYSSIQGDGVGRGLYWQGLTWLGGEFLTFLNCLRQSAGSSGLILDIGANTGIYSLIACAKNTTARVIAFEPVSHVYSRLVHNIKINNFENRCEAMQYVVSDSSGTAKLLVPPGLVPVEATLDIAADLALDSRAVEVNATTVDSICQEESVTLVKIDVEGLEHKVISGMFKVLARSRPTIIIEHHANCPRLAIEPLLSKFGYRFFHIADDGALIPVETFKTGLRQHFLCLAEK
jgi:FkbM family methyltransferase